MINVANDIPSNTSDVPTTVEIWHVLNASDRMALIRSVMLQTTGKQGVVHLQNGLSYRLRQCVGSEIWLDGMRDGHTGDAVAIIEDGKIQSEQAEKTVDEILQRMEAAVHELAQS